jgi:primosomal protein N' (replication factor Y)
MERKTLFADVILPLPVKGAFTYRIPFEWNDWVEPGIRVLVQFGSRKVYAALVKQVHENVPSDYHPKYLLAILDNSPIVHLQQFKFWDWISKYYISSIGEVMNAALPSGFKLSSESKLALHPEFEPGSISLSEKEGIVVKSLQHRKTLSLTEASEITDLQKIFPLIKTLLEKKVVVMEEELDEKYKPLYETRIRLNPEFQPDESLRNLFDILEKRAFKQVEVLMAFIKVAMPQGGLNSDISKKALLEQLHGGASALKALEEKGIFISYEQKISRLVQLKAEQSVSEIKLNEAQEVALDEIKKILDKKSTCLLHGITGSGKTEIYIKLIDEVVKQGKQVLYLLPEIALTSQIINRLRKYFGEKVGVYHSRYNTHERIEIWNSILQDSEDSPVFQIILSARSGIFLPFSKLGLIVVDEEHDSSYKQFDPAPRYHARDAALILAQLHGAKVILGSATPSVETYFNASSGKYGLVSLNRRFGEARLPEIIVSDLKHETKRKTIKGHFSSFLIEQIEDVLTKKEQVILFQNRRGFAPRLECSICNWVPECPNCDVSLVYHKNQNRLRCHICGYATHLIHKCEKCGSFEIKMMGFGTEKIEEDLGIILPQSRIQRMDLDTTRGKFAFDQLFDEFSRGNIDILVGTQMVTKGLDFENVSIVGVLNADNMINFPDFRAFERSFQMLVQVSGRAGRKDKSGKVIIQTMNPFHNVIRLVMDNNYKGMYQSQIAERNTFKYPPFYRLIRFTLKYQDYEALNVASSVFAQNLRNAFGNRILGPEYPLIAKMKGQFLKDILLKLEKGYSTDLARERIALVLDSFNQTTQYRSIRVVIDVDPY